MKNKENAIKNFLETIEQSRTRERLTDKEKNNFKDFLNTSQTVGNAVNGSYENCWEVLLALYDAYLLGCGYNGAFWRI